MRCPHCDKTALFRNEIDKELYVTECHNCGGQWLSFKDYQRWLKNRGTDAPHNELLDVEFESEDSKQAKICPECGRIMLKFKIGHGIDFKIDRCNTCNGVWFDKNEWNSLKSRNLHDEIYSIFSTEWQKQVLKEEKATHFEKSYRQKFGQDYSKIKEFKEWLERHKMKSTILAFLIDKNPFE